jgi:hypothetical protein
MKSGGVSSFFDSAVKYQLKYARHGAWKWIDGPPKASGPSIKYSVFE